MGRAALSRGSCSAAGSSLARAGASEGTPAAGVVGRRRATVRASTRSQAPRRALFLARARRASVRVGCTGEGFPGEGRARRVGRGIRSIGVRAGEGVRAYACGGPGVRAGARGASGVWACACGAPHVRARTDARACDCGLCVRGAGVPTGVCGLRRAGRRLRSVWCVGLRLRGAPRACPHGCAGVRLDGCVRGTGPCTERPACRCRCGYVPDDFAALAAAFISCLWARTLASESGPLMSATERKESASP